MAETEIKIINGRNICDAEARSAAAEKVPLPATAAVGQVLAVKAVDENGKPTEWGAVDAATDASGRECYFDITEDGVISLKEDYRGSGTSKYPASVGNGSLLELPEVLVIPDSVNGIEVTALAEGMFYGNTRVKEITLPTAVTAIPAVFCQFATNLRAVNRTDRITKIGSMGLAATRLKKACFPNLEEMGTFAFTACGYLEVVDIGKIETIPQNAFADCAFLCEVLGGDSVTAIDSTAFYRTRRLKDLPLLSHVTTVGKRAFFGSRICTALSSDDSIHAQAFPISDNDTDFWSGVQYAPCCHRITTKLSQSDPAWSTKTLLTDDSGNNILFSSGCALFAVLHIHSAITGKYYATPEDFVQELQEDDNLSQFMLYENWPGQFKNVARMFNALGYQTEVYGEEDGSDLTKEDYEALVKALRAGAYVYTQAGVAQNWENDSFDGGHAVALYGINELGEVYVLDSSVVHEYFRADGFEADADIYTYTMPYQNIVGPSSNFVVVYPPDVEPDTDLKQMTTEEASPNTTERLIQCDGRMYVGAVYKSGNVDTTKTAYMYTDLIPLTEAKSFQVVGVNTLGKTRHIELRYVTAYDADGNPLPDCSLENVAMAAPSEGRVIQMDEAVYGVVITIYKATDYTYKTVIVPGAGDETYTALKTEKLSGFETVLTADEFCYGSCNNGVMNLDDIYSVCTKGYIKPFVKRAELVSTDYRATVTVYQNGAYVKSAALLLPGSVYLFDHDQYQYKLHITHVDSTRLFDFNAPREAIKITVSTPDVLYAYHALQSARDAAQERTSKALEYLMRRNYDISYANAPAPIDLITYVGNNQIVHPKVLYFPDGFGGHRFWMAYTPYPWNWDIYENPSIAYSDDGYEWTNIDGNPLDDPQGVGINTDAHLVYAEDTGVLELWWRYVNTTLEVAPEIIYRMTSTDGINWTAKEVVNNNDSGDHVRYLSPSVLYDGSKYRIWVVNSTDNTIDYYEAQRGTEAIPEESIALDDTMMAGKVMQQGTLDETATGYMYTPMITLNATKSFRLTATNVNGITTNPALRYVTAYDADGNVLTDYSLQNVALVSGSEDRIVTMDNAVAAVVITIASASNLTDKTITLIGAEATGLVTPELKNSITLSYEADGTAYTLWHIDVIEDGGQLVMLAMCKGSTQWPLFLTTSQDNETYTTPELVMKGNPYGWDQLLYRSSIVNVDGEYRIYYTALGGDNKTHGLGITTSKTLSNFVGKW